MRRAAKLSANIAEGWARQSKKEFVILSTVAQGSCENLKPIFFYRKDADYQTPQKQLQYWMRLSSLVNN
jgi:four helix bundle protein